MTAIENRVLCNCMKVSYFDVQAAMESCSTLGCVEKTFDDVQAATHCSTGCGGCKANILDAISEIMHASQAPQPVGL